MMSLFLMLELYNIQLPSRKINSGEYKKSKNQQKLPKDSRR
jgi:hypothetical protein